MGDEGEAKPKTAYHHGDLGRSLVAAAVTIIAEQGEAALTLREVGQRLGVSRTALYRHFDGKAALLEAVALEGFRRLRQTLEVALAAAATGHLDPIGAIAEAYVAFGAAHPAHYRTMFGPALRNQERGPALKAEGQAAFGVLARAIAEGQATGRLGPGDPARLAQVVWALVHGIVALDGDGQFHPRSPATAAAPTLAPFAASVLLAGLLARPSREPEP